MSVDVYHAIYKVASALEVPVIVLALASLAFVVVEFGAFVLELFVRRRRRSGAAGVDVLTDAARAAARALRDGAPDRARHALTAVSWSAAMDTTLRAFVDHVGTSEGDSTVAKDLADFDFGRLRRLGRTRLLVRTGPALGLMGTLIPLAPALSGLANGHAGTLTANLRVAFSVTVLGLFVGAVAFLISLVRERVYGQDYSDLEYVAAVLTADGATPVVTADERSAT